MSQDVAIPEDKKLMVIYRIEPGCLGPNVAPEEIENFCRFAHQAMKLLHSDFIKCLPLPRYDKSLPELEYQLQGHPLSEEQVSRYLDKFGQDVDDFETDMHNKLSLLIDKYLERT